MIERHRVWVVAAAVAAFGLAACEGGDGLQGPAGEPGPAGGPGPQGEPGPAGTAGTSGTSGRSTYETGQDLAITILGAGIDGAGTATVSVRITDAEGVPLDREGLYTDGPVSLNFVLAALDAAADGGPGQYTAYTTRTVTSSSATVQQAAADQNGTFRELAPGEYLYTFGTLVPMADRGKTHTVGVYGTRTFEEATAFDDATFDFVPSGAPVTLRRDVVTDAACNSCHGQLAFHGGARRQVALCVLCHSPQTVDPDTGNTTDFKVMIHKIHRGADLPSVRAGGRYQLIGFRQSVHDYSTVAFPRDIRLCETCHQGTNGDVWGTRPSPAPCLACHDDIVFSEPVPAGKQLHGGGVQSETAPCTVCHPANGSIAPVVPAHRILQNDPARETLEIELLSIANTVPGATPTVRFRVTVNDQPRDISTRPLTVLRFTIAGPNTDFASYVQVTAQGQGATGTLSAVDAANGVFEYTFPGTTPIPATARGSSTLGAEAYLQVPPSAPRNAAEAVMLPFAVTDAEPVARREIVSTEKCNSCHFEVSGHGGSRRGSTYCALCHHPNNVNDERISRVEGQSVTVRSVAFGFMIHRIHAGEALQNPFVLGTFPAPSRTNPVGAPHDFAETRYPAIQGDCSQCHLDGTWNVTGTPGRLPVFDQIRTCLEPAAADTDTYCETPFWAITSTVTSGAESAACIGCHDGAAAVAHAELNTTVSGVESCAVCHGAGSVYDVNRVHPIR